MFCIDLNCDMGEGFFNDKAIMPRISSANIACGGHAGDKDIMQRTIICALEHGVQVGAHPGYEDRVHFGRMEMLFSAPQIKDLLKRQISELQEEAQKLGAGVCHIKPHGALYNQSARDERLAATIAETILLIDPLLILYGLSGSCSIRAAEAAGLKTVSEVFADRTYQNNGSLTPRSEKNALIEKEQASVTQVLQMIQQGNVTSLSGTTIPIVAQSICIHGDGADPVIFAGNIRKALREAGVIIQSPGHV